MNPERFDEVINLSLAHYGPIGVEASLLSVRDRHSPQPPGEWYTVVVEVEPVTAQPTPYAETWNYGGLISHERGPVPLGVRTINAKKLIGAVKAAKELPPGYDLKKASANLSWPLVPNLSEPLYSFLLNDSVFNVGAYTGKTYE